ncbi:DUF2341 domain-containing protein, partial [Candidatus Omnitrophota bacterium]
VKNAAGGTPAATTAADQNWSIFRAYTALANWESGTDNSGIDTDVDGFDTGNRDIFANREQWNIACYADAADTTAVIVDGWTTETNNYIKIYTPTATSEVGTTQRHAGVWDATKYALTVTGDDAIIMTGNAGYARIEGLQISIAPDDIWQRGIYTEVGEDMRISHNIIKKANDQASNNIFGIQVEDEYSQISIPGLKIFNNVIYDFDENDNAGFYAYDMGFGGPNTAFVYNNTFYNCVYGIQLEVSGGTNDVTAINNIMQSVTDGFNGTFNASSDYNISNVSSDQPASGANDQTAITIPFVDEVNYNFHLAPNAANAINVGTTTPYTTDIDGSARPIGAAWDIGADEEATGSPSVATIYRSVGFGNTGAIAAGGGGNDLTISGTTATFSVAIGNSIGVGDVIQYDKDNGGSVDSICFISGRTSSTSYTVQNVAGTTPTATSTDDQDWAIFRAYTSLALAEAGTENTGLDDDLQTFESWSAGKDISASTGTNEQWNIACYADAADTTAVNIDGWTTETDTYLKIYTPTSTSEVGTTQRHDGSWDAATTAYTLDVNGSHALEIEDDYVRAEGLQVEISTDTVDGYHKGIPVWKAPSGGSDVRATNNIVRQGASSSQGYVYALACHSGKTCAFANNIVYDVVRTGQAGDDPTGLYADNTGGSTTVYAYNNTFYNCYYGIENVDADTVVLKNNVVLASVSDNYVPTAAFDSSSTNNASSSGDAPGSGDITLGTTDPTHYFVSTTDFHIDNAAPSASEIIDAGVDLSLDDNLAFSDDIEGESRALTTWDIGADEYIASGDGSCATGSSSASWYNASWTNRKLVTIDCAMTPNADQSNIPVLIYTATETDLAADAQTDFDDVLFTTADGAKTKLDHEIEGYDSGTGELTAWVEIPTLGYSADTNIYMYYNNSAAANQQDINGT